MSRVKKKRVARAHGYRGNNMRDGVTVSGALKRAATTQAAAKAQAEHDAYVEKIQSAAIATREMGLVIPGQ